MQSNRAARLLRAWPSSLGIGIATALFGVLAPLTAVAQEDAPVGSLEAVDSSASPAADATEAPASDAASEPPPLDGSEPPSAECETPDAAAVRDWIKLTSGEWLSGDIDRIRDGVVYIDSEELDDIEVDLVDVTAIRSTRKHTFRFEGRKIYTGTVSLDGDQITIGTADGPKTFDTGKLVAMIPGEPTEKNYWSGDMSVGFTLRQGNTEQTDLTAVVKLMRETAITRFTTTYNGNFNITDDETQANSHRVAADFNVFVTRALYLVVPTLEYYRDEIQNIEGRVTPAAGLGYEVVKRSWIEWDLTAAAGYQYLVNGPDTVGGSNVTSSDATVLLGTVFNLDPTADLEWDTTYQASVVVTDLGQTSHHLLSVLSFDVWGPLDFDTTFVWDRIESPASGVDSDTGAITTPESDDVRITIGLGIDF